MDKKHRTHSIKKKFRRGGGKILREPWNMIWHDFNFHIKCFTYNASPSFLTGTEWLSWSANTNSPVLRRRWGELALRSNQLLCSNRDFEVSINVVNDGKLSYKAKESSFTWELSILRRKLPKPTTAKQGTKKARKGRQILTITVTKHWTKEILPMNFLLHFSMTFLGNQRSQELHQWLLLTLFLFNKRSIQSYQKCFSVLKIPPYRSILTSQYTCIPVNHFLQR